MSEITIIQPTVGRVVWYFPDPNSRESDFIRLTKGPFAALIAHVHGETSINLTVFDSCGVPHARESVLLVQAHEDQPQGSYATWMPYQVGQARRLTEADADADLAGTPRPPR